MNPLSEAKFIKFHTLIGLQETVIMGGCAEEVILPLESPECFADRGALEHRSLLVHHIPGASGDN